MKYTVNFLEGTLGYTMLEESKDLTVLGAIRNGAKQFDKISKMTKIAQLII